MTVRKYVTTNEEAVVAVRDIQALITKNEVEPIISTDIETMPIEGLEGFPQRYEDEETGKSKWPNKRTRRTYFLRVTRQNFDLAKLRELNIVVPMKKLTNKKQDELDALALQGGPAYDAAVEAAYSLQGKNANEQWEFMRNEIEGCFERVPSALERCRLPDAKLPTALWVHLLALAEDEDRIKVDPIEPGLDPYTSDIRVLQFTVRRYNGELMSWAFNLARVDKAICRPLLELDVLYMGQNFKFDLKHFIHNFGIAPDNVYCTSVAEKILFLGLRGWRRNLDALAKRYLTLELDKSVRDTFIGVRGLDLSPEQLQYVFDDTEVLFGIRDKQLELARERGQEFAVDVFCKLSTPVAYWEYEGYIVDGEKWMEIAREVEQKRDEAAAKVMGTLLPPSYGALFDDDETPEAGDAPFSLTQVEMVRQALERLMGFPVTSLDKDGRANAERDYRARNSGETHPFFKLYAKWSKLNKQSSTYGARFLWAIHPLSGRVHPNFGIAGTNTARFTCRGQNLLNIPTKKGDDDVDFRGAFVAPDGHKWGNADYSAMEQRIAACETGDPVLVALFQSGKDSHSTTAAMMFHLRRDGVSEPVVVEEEFKNGTETQTIKVLLVPAKWDDKKLFEYATSEQVLGYVTKDGTRTVAKMVGFLFYFGGGPYTLAVRTGASERVAEDFFGRYTSTYAVLAAKFEEFGQLPFQNAEVWRDGFEYGYVEAYGGLRRWFRLPKNPSRLDYDNDWKGAAAFKQAQRDYRKQNGAIGREAKNVKTQGGNAMIMAEAILALWESGKPFGVRPWLAIYDELLVQVPEKMPDDMANYLIETSMTEPAEKYMTLVDCVAEASPCTRVWTKH